VCLPPNVPFTFLMMNESSPVTIHDAVCELSPQDVSRFWSYVHRRQDHQCWNWVGSTMQKRGGYGQLRLNGTTYKAHRVSWLIHFGKLPDEPVLRHMCNNPLCCNPTHLLPGSYKDNHDDMRQANRMFVPVSPKGEEHHSSRLTEDQVLAIFQSDRPGTELAAKYGVTKSMISRIRTGRSWKHVTYRHL
jgi:hypothetical protein